MNIFNLTFPLTVDFSGGKYWINGEGPYLCGEASTAFLAGEIRCESTVDTSQLMQELETVLKIFGSHLSPYSEEQETTDDVYQQLKQSAAACSVNYAFLPLQGSIVLAERYTFPTLRDFLYVELGRAILHGNAPRQCRLCGGWFLHKQGDRAIYCERTAPGQTEKTCREMGARMVFEKKLQDEDTWKLYKRAYKKYYARCMKGNMSEDEFKAWGEQAAADRDAAIEQLKAAADAALSASIIQQLKENLNRL
ncbi:DUF6076 domain-containing protein [uncultured Oscillibacter sp.]|uniref:DUF6076 domain-containing protein n=1 Tax=uncultured Oscillibacter sp. TaxID=876091 RepID=UPI00260CE532|nr:DUF6076 domain-containing protein [uncultured Oscillibacter sp.]